MFVFYDETNSSKLSLLRLQVILGEIQLWIFASLATVSLRDGFFIVTFLTDGYEVVLLPHRPFLHILKLAAAVPAVRQNSFWSLRALLLLRG